MKIIKKTGIIISIVFFVRILSSCFPCDCSDEVFFFDFEKVEIINLDNSQFWVNELEADTMKKAAVAFEIRIKPDEEQYEQYVCNFSYSFSSAYAFSCDCSPKFKANQQISKIKIITLFDISDQAKANSDVTDLFVAYKENYYGSNQLYIPIPNLYERINSDIYYDTQVQGFQLFMTQEIQNDSAQFIIEIELSDNRVLSDTTNILTIE